MATVQRVLTLALRKQGEIAANERPDGPLLNDGLQSFQSMIDNWVSSGLLGSVSDALAEADLTSAENVRITSLENIDLTLPYAIEDADAESGYRPPQDGAVIIAALGGPHTTYVYNALIADWQTLTDLTLDSTAPLSGFGVDGLASAVAEYMGGDLTDDTRRSAARFKSALALRFGETRAVTEGVFY